MKQMKAKLLLGILGMTMAACSQAVPKLEPTPKIIPKPLVEKAEVTSYPMVDILFVIDDSGSMDSHQLNLAANVNLFVNQILGSSLIDYHIGVITTSVNDSESVSDNGKLYGSPTFVTRNTPNALQVLQNNLKVGTGGATIEMVFRPTMMALSEPNLSGPNQGFFRPGAHLALVFITDAEDQSGYYQALEPQTFYDFLLKLKGGRKELILPYAVIVPSTDTTRCPRDDYRKPNRIEQFLSLSGVGGKNMFSLCDPDYGQKLANLGSDLYRRILGLIYLSRQPVMGTISVRYGTQVIDEDPLTGWIYDPVRVALRFSPDIVWTVQPQGTGLDIEFVPVK